MSKQAKNWISTREWSDITEMVKTACCVIDTLENVDFGRVGNGDQVKAEITEDCLTIIQIGLQAVLSE